MYLSVIDASQAYGLPHLALYLMHLSSELGIKAANPRAMPVNPELSCEH
ncbi:hypothetical protein [Vulcanisaeta sp. JCM 16159]|nr:hypothetical protein [Vulcanisaeta sp. JCM 16159]